MSVLIEESKEEYSIGHTDNYIKVIIDTKLNNNTFYDIKINSVVKTDVKGIYNS